jgi:PAS domain S-box-containing protein
MKSKEKLHARHIAEITALRARVTELEAVASKHGQVEEMFRRLLEAAPDAIVVVNHDGKICLVNLQTERLFGCSRNELLGQSLEILMPERFRRAHQNYRAGYFMNPHVRPMGDGLDLYGLHKNGSEISIEVSLSPLETAEGPMIMSAIRDVTQRKQYGRGVTRGGRHFGGPGASRARPDCLARYADHP